MIKLSTINQIVEAILAEGEATVRIDIDPVLGDYEDGVSREDFLDDWRRIANEATIYLKMAMICEDKGIDAAMEYFLGNHSEDEYKEFRTEVEAGNE